MLTHFASLDFIAIAADLDRGAGSRVKRGKGSTKMVIVSLSARFAVGLSHGSFGSAGVGNFTEELAINFAQWARHVAHGVLMIAIVDVDDDSKAKSGGC